MSPHSVDGAGHYGTGLEHEPLLQGLKRNDRCTVLYQYVCMCVYIYIHIQNINKWTCLEDKKNLYIEVPISPSYWRVTITYLNPKE